MRRFEPVDRPDPFVHHPELRSEIADPLGSSMRTLTTARLAARMQDMGLPGGWWHSDEEREADRVAALADRLEGDLCVFGYGSLMWDPAIRFEEVRRARVAGYSRRFILKDVHGGRGTREAPGVMAALDEGKECEGLLFRIAQEHVEIETQILWRRERLTPAYTARFVDAMVDRQCISALTFVADHASPLIDRTLTRDQQIHYLATGVGVLGSSIDYLRNIARKFDVLGIDDEEVKTLLADAEAYLRSRSSILGQ